MAESRGRSLRVSVQPRGARGVESCFASIMSQRHFRNCFKNNCQILAISFKSIMPTCSMSCQCTESTSNIVPVRSTEPLLKRRFPRWPFPLDLDLGFARCRRVSVLCSALAAGGGVNAAGVSTDTKKRWDRRDACPIKTQKERTCKLLRCHAGNRTPSWEKLDGEIGPGAALTGA